MTFEQEILIDAPIEKGDELLFMKWAAFITWIRKSPGVVIIALKPNGIIYFTWYADPKRSQHKLFHLNTQANVMDSISVNGRTLSFYWGKEYRFKFRNEADAFKCSQHLKSSKV